jgi:hypothetical protein
VRLFPSRQPIEGEKQKEYQEESEALAVKISQRRARARGGYLRERTKFHLSCKICLVSMGGVATLISIPTRSLT